MSDISKIDKNFKIETKIEKSDIKFHNVLTSPFKIHGVYYDGGKFRRMPEAVAKAVSPGVHILHSNTAGGRVRFRTDSPYIAINAKMPSVGKMSHFALCGSSGFDLYVDGVYCRSYLPPFDISDGYEGIADMLKSGMKEVLINFPLYSDVSELYIGLAKTAEILEPTPYTYEKPVVYYGSSITQGGCASRPGTSYQGFVSRELDTDYINLGFSGNARAEKEMYDYIKTLDMSAFVMDYDHNTPSVEYLASTHEKMFLAIREAQPSLPIIMMSAPVFTLNDQFKARFDVIKRTYDNAVSRGDGNVYLIDGPTLMKLCGNEGTVDNTHPTDLGFYSMACAVTEVLKKVLGK